MEKSPPPTSSLSSYTILAISLPPIPSFPKEATHYMYLRKDTPTAPTPDTPRSLFLSNVPVDASEAALRTFFKQIAGARVDRVDSDEERAGTGAGEVLVKGRRWGEETDGLVSRKRKRVQPEAQEQEGDLALPSTWSFTLRKSGSSAVVVFVDRATAEMVLKECRRMQKKGEKVPWTQTEELGLKRYKTHHTLTYPPKGELQHKVNTYLTQYAALEEVRSRKLKQLRSEPDEEGFVTVVRGGRVGPARLEDAQAAAERLKEREKKRVGGTFYRFQTREEAKKRERALREKFEDDARRLREMRERKGAIKPEG